MRQNKRSTRLRMTGWERWFTGNYVSDWNLTYYQMVYVQTTIRHWEWDVELLGILRYKPITLSRPEYQTCVDNQEKRTCHPVDFAVPESETKRNKKRKETSTWTLLENWKKQWNMKVTVLSIVPGALGTVPKSLEKDWRIRKSGKESKYPDHSIVEIC